MQERSISRESSRRRAGGLAKTAFCSLALCALIVCLRQPYHVIQVHLEEGAVLIQGDNVVRFFFAVFVRFGRSARHSPRMGGSKS